MLCTQRPPWISDPDISDNSPVFPSILIINSLVGTVTGTGKMTFQKSEPEPEP
jgi:hypothetical protein